MKVKATATAAKGTAKATANAKATAAKGKATAKTKAKAKVNGKTNRRDRAARQTAVDPKRFVRATHGIDGSSSAGSWRPPWGDLFRRSTYLTEFLGRLWALFGSPTGDNGKGFEYGVCDTATGEILQAYSAASGPSFGNARGTWSESVTALQALINATAPIDCETTVDHGASQIGIRDGKHFYDYQGPEDDTFAD